MADKPPTKAQRRAQAHKNCATALAECKRRFDAGEKPALIDAMYWCALGNMPLPVWAARAFTTGYHEAAFDLKMKSWDDLFGWPNWQKRKVLASRRAKELDIKIFRRVRVLKAAKPRPPHIFEKVAAEFGIGRKVCEKKYYGLLDFYGLKDRERASHAKARR